jgi:hypothetical protein
VNKDKIFELFENGGMASANPKSTLVEKILDSPYNKIGMFTKLIINHFTFHKKLKKFFKEEGTEFNMEKVKEASQYTVFNRAWYYIEQIDVKDKDHIKAIGEFECLTFNKALQDSISHFEDREEYERCAHLFKIKEIVNTFENS